MDSRRFQAPARLGRWHALIERYTPDGWLGRCLLGSTTGTVGVWLLALALFEVPRWGLSLAALFWLPAFLGLGLPALVLSLTVLWPVYLSLIGNIGSADAYPLSEFGDRSTRNGGIPGGERGASPPVERTDASESSADDPFGDLKLQYANGDISEEEFERRLEARLEDGVEPVRSTTDDAGDTGRRDRVSERN